MKRKVIQVISVLLTLSLLVCISSITSFAAGTGEFDPPGNVVVNPGFENSTDGWNKSGYASVIIMGSGHSGGHCAAFGPSLPGTTAVLSQDIILNRSGEYTLSIYLSTILVRKTPTRIKVTNLDRNTVLAQNEQIPQKGEFHLLSLNFTAVQGTKIQISIERQSESCLIDDVCLVRTGDGGIADINVLNPGFEVNLLGWEMQGTPNAFVTDALAHTGNKALFLSYFKKESFENCVVKTLEAEEGYYYTFSAWIKAAEGLDGSRGPTLAIMSKDASGTPLGETRMRGTDSTDWLKFSASFFTSPGTSTITIKIGSMDCIGAFYVDDVTLYKSDYYPY